MDGLSWDFDLVVPKGWYVYDPDPSTRQELTAAAVDEHIRTMPELAPARQTLIAVLDGFWSDADDELALAAAVFWEPGTPAAVAANLMVVAYSKAPSLEKLRTGALQATEFDVRERDVRLVDLPAGSAVRVRAVRRSGGDDGDAELLVEVVEHWVPIPDTSDVLVLRGSTPCLDVAEELAEVFDQIAGMLEFRSVPAGPDGTQ